MFCEQLLSPTPLNCLRNTRISDLLSNEPLQDPTILGECWPGDFSSRFQLKYQGVNVIYWRSEGAHFVT